jgi:hypothetical protein
MFRTTLFLIFMPCFFLSLMAETPQNLPLPTTNESHEKSLVVPSSNESQEKSPALEFPYTGKILGNKVRMRLKADLESPVVGQLKKNDLLLVKGEDKEFFSVTPPKDFKAYVFRSFILDNTVISDRVNARLQPNLEAPILLQLKKGDKVFGNITSLDNEWIEFPIPQSVNFYVAKDFLTFAGDRDYYAKMEKRKDEAKKLLQSAYFLTTSECKKPFDEMNCDEAISQFEALIKGYTEFPDYVQGAKDGLSLLQDNYLQKKISFLENKANITDNEKEELFTKLSSLSKSLQLISEEDTPSTLSAKHVQSQKQPSSLPQHMAAWLSIEDELFQTWATYNPQKTVEDFYNEQKVNATKIKGVVYKYEKKSASKPGNYLLKKDSTPVAFLYSTEVDLENAIGEEVSLSVTPRPNNRYAFPAYFVNSIEK